MAGLYIHIPFCKSRCIYCGFYSTVGLELRQKYVDAVCREMELRPSVPDGLAVGASSAAAITTVYLGGGTPSQLTISQLRQLFTHINKVYGNKASEVTIEVNPDDVTARYAEALPRLGINRVSMGVQTFDNQRLRFLHRRHSAGQVPQAVQHLREAGISNISIDLMYGFPDETLSDWEQDIDQALRLNVEHLSAYCLMIEEGTPLYQMGTKPADEESERQMYDLLTDKLTEAGYEHYELSNFAKPGRRSQHNSSYWTDVPYLGLGAAAHSYLPHRGTVPVCGRGTVPVCGVRQWNVADLRQYIKAIERGEIPCEEEVLDADTRYNDRITVALRTREGLDLTTLSEKHRHYCLHEAQRFLDDGLLECADDHLRLTRRGLFVSDYVMSSLVYV